MFFKHVNQVSNNRRVLQMHSKTVKTLGLLMFVNVHLIVGYH